MLVAAVLYILRVIDYVQKMLSSSSETAQTERIKFHP